MSENKNEVNIGFFIPTQMAMLVIHYGNIVQGLPVWVIWLPIGLKILTVIIGLLVAGIIGLAIWLKER